MSVSCTCVRQFAVTVFGASIVTDSTRTVETRSPVHPENADRVPAPPGTGLVAVIVATLPRSYQPSPVVPPTAEMSVSCTWVEKSAVSATSAVTLMTWLIGPPSLQPENRYRQP